MSGLSKLLILAGVLLIAAGFLMPHIGKIPWIGKLPGDVYIQRGNFTLYFPLMTCILISIILTLLIKLLGGK